jgi:hypothetical protein
LGVFGFLFHIALSLIAPHHFLAWG